MPVTQFRSAGPMTLNNFTNDELEHLRVVTSLPGTKIKYICWIQEVGENGTPHLQVYAQAYEKLSVKQWHKQLGYRMSNIVPTIDQKAAMEYCQGYLKGQPKPGSDLATAENYGKSPTQGDRTDISTAVSELKKRPLSELVDEGHAVTDTMVKHYRFFKELDERYIQQRAFESAKEEHNQYLATRVRLPWEYKLKEIVESCNDTRVIHWFYDSEGETGKTVNAKDLYFNHNAYYCTGGKANDIYLAYNYEPIVILNLVASSCKDTMDYLYKVLEEFKDGIFSSGKYMSKTKVFKIPQVIVFSNELPDMTKMKKNRIQYYNIQVLNGTRDYTAPNEAE